MAETQRAWADSLRSSNATSGPQSQRAIVPHFFPVFPLKPFGEDLFRSLGDIFPGAFHHPDESVHPIREGQRRIPRSYNLTGLFFLQHGDLHPSPGQFPGVGGDFFPGTFQNPLDQCRFLLTS